MRIEISSVDSTGLPPCTVGKKRQFFKASSSRRFGGSSADSTRTS